MGWRMMATPGDRYVTGLWREGLAGASIFRMSIYANKESDGTMGSMQA